MILLDKEAIQRIIPHRPPFLMIDNVEVNEAEKSAKGTKKLIGDEDFFKGHFPDEPIMPGVLIIEAIAQLGAAAILSIDEFKGKRAYLASVENAMFRRKVVPGETLELYVEFISFRHSIGKGLGKAFVNGMEVCSVKFGFFFS